MKILTAKEANEWSRTAGKMNYLEFTMAEIMKRCYDGEHSLKCTENHYNYEVYAYCESLLKKLGYKVYYEDFCNTKRIAIEW